MMLQRYWSTVLGAAFALGATAQTTAILTGRVTDATSSLGLVNAAVEVSIGDTALITLSDSLGYFRFAAVPTGIAEVRASLVGYASVAQSDVWLRSGKPEQVELQLPREGKELPQATVRGVLAPLPPRPGTYELTVEKSLRYPATFFDPARLASTYPGVATTNDQANHFSVRGNGPNSNVERKSPTAMRSHPAKFLTTNRTIRTIGFRRAARRRSQGSMKRSAGRRMTTMSAASAVMTVVAKKRRRRVATVSWLGAITQIGQSLSPAHSMKAKRAMPRRSSSRPTSTAVR